jgi:glycerophosphoryl diester phosphodiesterase
MDSSRIDKHCQVTVGEPHNPKSPKYVEVYAHRGVRSYSPENTIPSFATALVVGADWLDIDIGMTADGVIVASHDPWLNPDIVSKNGAFWALSKGDFIAAHSGNFHEAVDPYLLYKLSLKEVKQFEVGIINLKSAYSHYFPDQLHVPGTAIPTLQEVIDFASRITNNQINYQIEIKNEVTQPDWTASPKELASAVYTILKSNDLIGKVEVQSFDWNCLFELQKIDKKMKTAYLFGAMERSRMRHPDPIEAGLLSRGKLLKEYNHSFPQMIKSLGGSCYEPEDITLTKEELDEAHQLGLKVVVWTWPENTGRVFDSKLVRKLIDWGVDGIITDDPGQLISLLAARGMRVPASYRL